MGRNDCFVHFFLKCCKCKATFILEQHSLHFRGNYHCIEGDYGVLMQRAVVSSSMLKKARSVGLIVRCLIVVGSRDLTRCASDQVTPACERTARSSAGSWASAILLFALCLHASPVSKHVALVRRLNHLAVRLSRCFGKKSQWLSQLVHFDHNQAVRRRGSR